MIESNLNQEETILRVKLDSFSLALKKLANAFLYAEAETSVTLVEPQIINRLLRSASGLQSLKSLGGDDGEVYASFLKNITEIIQNIGALSRKLANKNYESRTKILKAMKSLENEINEFSILVSSIDEIRKTSNYETFGGFLQKLIDAIQEKRHLILRIGE